jgi:hypothetical protein
MDFNVIKTRPKNLKKTYSHFVSNIVLQLFTGSSIKLARMSYKFAIKARERVIWGLHREGLSASRSGSFNSNPSIHWISGVGPNAVFGVVADKGNLYFLKTESLSLSQQLVTLLIEQVISSWLILQNALNVQGV